MTKTYSKDNLTIDQMHSNPLDAKADGHTYYFTGEPCIHGHISVRNTVSRRCYQCLQNYYQSEPYKKFKQKYWLKNKKRLSLLHTEWMKNNREGEKARHRKRYKKDPEKFIDRSKKYYQENREVLLEKKRKYREANKEKLKAQRRAYYLKKKKEKE